MSRETEFVGEVLDLHRGQRLGERVSPHFLCGAINQVNFPIFNDPSNEMEVNVDMFRY